MSSWKSKLPEITRRMEGDATRSGLKAAGEVIVEVIRDDVKDGFTTGAFTTGKLGATAIKRQRPGPKRVKISTGNPVLIAWTLGHHNVFTQQYERVDTFTAALTSHGRQAAEAFGKRYKEKLTELAHKAAMR